MQLINNCLELHTVDQFICKQLIEHVPGRLLEQAGKQKMKKFQDVEAVFYALISGYWGCFICIFF